MKKLFSFLHQNFSMGEILFMMGMLLLYRGVSVLLSPSFAQAACGSILIIIGFIIGRQA